MTEKGRACCHSIIDGWSGKGDWDWTTVVHNKHVKLLLHAVWCFVTTRYETAELKSYPNRNHLTL